MEQVFSYIRLDSLQIFFHVLVAPQKHHFITGKTLESPIIKTTCISVGAIIYK